MIPSLSNITRKSDKAGQPPTPEKADCYSYCAGCDLRTPTTTPHEPGCSAYVTDTDTDTDADADADADACPGIEIEPGQFSGCVGTVPGGRSACPVCGNGLPPSVDDDDDDDAVAAVRPHAGRLVGLPDTIAVVQMQRSRGTAHLAFERSGLLPSARWSGVRVSQGTAKFLVAVAAELRERQWGALRVVSGLRLAATVKAERAAFDSWITAGRPSHNRRLWSNRMLDTYQPRLNESHEQWGGAVVVDVEGSKVPGNLEQKHARMAMVMHRHGFIAKEWADDSAGVATFINCVPFNYLLDFDEQVMDLGVSFWHFVAQVSNVLMGTFAGERQPMRRVQARLLLAGRWAGLPTGTFTKDTREALESLGIRGVTNRTPASVIHAMLDKAGEVGLDRIEQL